MTEAPYTLTRKDIAGTQDWLVIRANTTDELLALDGNAALIMATLRENRGVYNGSAIGTPVAAPQAAPVQQPVAPQQQPAQQGVPTPQCNHGSRVYKTGNGKRGKWEAWFCSAGQNDPGKCDPVWID